MASGDQVGFEADIKPLFRDRDQRSMKFVFDLWSYDDVKANADAIVEASAAATCPATGPGRPSRSTLFQAWIDADFPA